MRFEKEIEILNSKEKVWAFLWDIDRFITCVPGCKEAKTVEAGKKTHLSLGVTVDILGKLATLGHSIIKRKADLVMEEFAQALKNRLEGVS